MGLLLMVQKSGVHQLRLVVYLPWFAKFKKHPSWFSRQISESSNSMSPKKPDHSVSNEPKWTIFGGYLCDNVTYSHPINLAPIKPAWEGMYILSEKSRFIFPIQQNCDHPGVVAIFWYFLGGGVVAQPQSESVLGFNCTDFVWWFRGPLRCFNSWNVRASRKHYWKMTALLHLGEHHRV